MAELSAAGEAEAGTAREQPANDYASAPTAARRRGALSRPRQVPAWPNDDEANPAHSGLLAQALDAELALQTN